MPTRCLESPRQHAEQRAAARLEAGRLSSSEQHRPAPVLAAKTTHLMLADWARTLLLSRAGRYTQLPEPKH